MMQFITNQKKKQNNFSSRAARSRSSIQLPGAERRRGPTPHTQTNILVEKTKQTKYN